MFTKIRKRIKGYKTLISNFLLTSIPIVVLVSPEDLNLNSKQLATYTVFVTAANIYLRFKTSTKVGKKQ